MSDYTPKYMGMGKTRYYAVLGILRDYDQNIADAKALLERGRNLGDGQPHGTDKTDPVGDIASKREKILDKIRAVDDSMEEIPAEYRDALWQWVKEGKALWTIPGAEYISNRTMYSCKKKLLCGIEERMGWKV